MKVLRKRSELVILTLSLTLGFAGTCLYAEYAELPSPLRTEQAAWWGGLYPEYCLPGAMEAVEAEGDVRTGETDGVGAEVKIRFKYLTFLNELGGTDE